MTAGTPLTDEDRLPWLQKIRATGEAKCREEWEAGRGRWEDHDADVAKGKLGRPAVVIACSALTKRYRDILRGDIEVLHRNKVAFIRQVLDTDVSQICERFSCIARGHRRC